MLEEAVEVQSATIRDLREQLYDMQVLLNAGPLSPTWATDSDPTP